jgi:hypothetical protein
MGRQVPGYPSFLPYQYPVPTYRVADPVHFRPYPDPNPANHNFETGSRILLALKESIQTSNFFHIKQIYSDL